LWDLSLFAFFPAKKTIAQTTQKQNKMNTSNNFVNVRYMVENVDTAVLFYTKYLGFSLMTNSAPAFAAVVKGNLRLLLSGRTSSAGRAMPDGTLPFPGGWNRIELIVEDLNTEVDSLKKQGLHFRNEIINGPGGSQILLIDPSGNLVELLQPADK
jgi:predicted enzyme related to lactoylglutathione lyase